jgi:hypothetical protein
MSASKADLIADLQEVAKKTDAVTRDYYRGSGKHSDKAWQKHFSKFEDFCLAAGVNQPSTISEINGNSWNVFIPSTTLCSADDVIKYCKVDLSVWELDRFRAKDVSKDDEQKFQISAFFKKRKNIIEIQKEIQSLKDIAKANSVKPLKLERSAKLSGNMLEIGIPDLHVGKLAWPTETMHEPYDVQIAEAMFNRALNVLIDRSKAFTWDKVLFVVGNDLLNSDNAEGTTTKGTAVTTDIRYHKTFRVARNLMISAIEKLRLIAPVKVVVCPGNHDTLATYHLGDSLECYFHKYEDVEIENIPCPRKYVEWGKVMLMYCHGDKGNFNDYALLMATEQPEMFGRTKFREVHCGHTHQTKLNEQHGIRVRVLPSLSPPDDWHSEQGFTGNLRNGEAYFWNKDQGLVGMAIYNDDSQPVLMTDRMLVDA